jgi:hypothetical protein
MPDWSLSTLDESQAHSLTSHDVAMVYSDKRDSQSISQWHSHKESARKDSAVHVSLSSDSNVKQRDNEDFHPQHETDFFPTLLVRCGTPEKLEKKPKRAGRTRRRRRRWWVYRSGCPRLSTGFPKNLGRRRNDHDSGLFERHCLPFRYEILRHRSIYFEKAPKKLRWPRPN